MKMAARIMPLAGIKKLIRQNNPQSKSSRFFTGFSGTGMILAIGRTERFSPVAQNW